MIALMYVAPKFQPVFRELGIDADAVFDHSLIKPWRTLGDRENCTLDATLSDGRHVRLHVKRYPASARRGQRSPAEDEVAGLKLLADAGIPTATLVAWGRTSGGRSFVMTEDLAGYDAADKLVESGLPFDRLLEPTAGLAAKLHSSGLHHRDLYLCHFFAQVEPRDVRLIDAARVKPLPGWLTRRRWIVKDLAQFWYSTLSLPITDDQREAWLRRYESGAGPSAAGLRRAVERKVRQIARHDAKLRARQPRRNISIPL